MGTAELTGGPQIAGGGLPIRWPKLQATKCHQSGQAVRTCQTLRCARLLGGSAAQVRDIAMLAGSYLIRLIGGDGRTHICKRSTLGKGSKPC